MADRKSIFANISALAAGQMIAMALGFVTHAILARAVGPADYGILGFAVAIMSYFGIAASLGTDTWGSREIASRRSDVRRIAETILSLRLILSTLSIVGVVCVIMIWRPDALVVQVVLIQSASLFVAALTLDFAFQGIERLNAAARRQVLSAVIALVGIASVLGLGYGIVAATAMLQAAALISVVVMLWEFSRIAGIPHLGSTALSEWRRILREATPLAITVVVVNLYLYVDIVMLGFLRPGAEVGQYVAATRVLTIGLLVASILRTAILPVLSRLQSSPTERREIGSHHARVVATAGGLAAVGGFILAPEILEIIFGAEFREAATALRILMIGLLFMNPVEVFHTQLVAWRLQIQQMWIMIAGAIFNIVLNLVWIPRYGMDGAAGATLASTILILCFAAITLARHRFETHIREMGAAILLAGAIGLLAWWIDIPIDGLVTRFLIIGSALTIVYVGLAIALGIVRPAETLRQFSRI
jgi:O-antigen/teichoic acid export membrane protein